MIIENYLDFGFPYSDMLLQYGEHIAMSLSGSGFITLLKN